MTHHCPHRQALALIRVPILSRSLLFVLLTLCPLQAELLLVDDGHPRATIVMGTKTTANERLGAEELRDYLHEISGTWLLQGSVIRIYGSHLAVPRGCLFLKPCNHRPSTRRPPP